MTWCGQSTEVAPGAKDSSQEDKNYQAGSVPGTCPFCSTQPCPEPQRWRVKQPWPPLYPESGLASGGGESNGQHLGTAFWGHEQQHRLTPPLSARLGLKGTGVRGW